MKIMSSFTHPQVVQNLYECLCSVENKGRYPEECGKQSRSGHHWLPLYLFPTMEINGAPKQPAYKLSSKYLPLCSSEQTNSYRFGTTWGWVNDDRFFFFCVNYPFKTGFVVRVTKWHILCKGHSYPLQLEMLPGWWPDWLLWVTSLLWKPSQNLLALYQPEGKTSTRGLEHLRQCYFVEVIEVCVLKGKWKKLASKSFWMKLKSRYWFVIYLPPLTTDDQVPPEGLLRVGGGAETSTDAPWDI